MTSKLGTLLPDQVYARCAPLFERRPELLALPSNRRVLRGRGPGVGMSTTSSPVAVPPTDTGETRAVRGEVDPVGVTPGDRSPRPVQPSGPFLPLWSLFDLGVCRGCGCDDLHACESGCWWIEVDLCSACAPP